MPHTTLQHVVAAGCASNTADVARDPHAAPTGDSGPHIDVPPPTDRPERDEAVDARGAGADARPPRTWALVGAALLLILLGAFTLRQVTANLRYDEAVATHRLAIADARAAVHALAEAEADATTTREIAMALLEAPDAFVDTAAKAELSTLAAGLDLLIDKVAELDEEPSMQPRRRPVWYANLDRASGRLESGAARFDARAADAASRAASLSAADDVTKDSGLDFVAAIQPVAASFEAAHGSARNLDRIAFRTAVKRLAGAGTWGPDVSARVDAYVAAATAVQESHAAEEAEKAGPLYERRVAVEAFARSIVGGVLLEFDWAPTVSGHGDGGFYAGTATWDPRGGGISTITLTNSVAEAWNDPNVVALVAHQVGHAITAKCYGDIISPETPEENEAWATAWAIGMGYTADGNGESDYGRPSDELIDLSKKCR